MADILCEHAYLCMHRQMMLIKASEIIFTVLTEIKLHAILRLKVTQYCPIRISSNYVCRNKILKNNYFLLAAL